MNKTLLVMCVIVMAACGTKKVLTKDDADVARGALKYPGYTLTEFHAGKTATESYCGSCHALKNPANFNEAQLSTTVPKMVKKANRKAGSEVIDAKTQESILKYMVTMSSAPAVEAKN
ncbi:hypothetical protein [Solitalea lacus]|uniref:hypothetical protein n=1 Tax=Solitalea lacus TaxID=2911172 RepID=UPI001EDA6FEB|nr:hypothetical protein [Solitalea lacus]UKJ07126.1 hypothetical protein L2B55_16540 [Solitalea lacus]UKJ07128.1 hypothetical protein L2B55_16555 [Solitalea lacus]